MKRFVLMGDVVRSSEKHGAALMANFKELTASVNTHFAERIISPLTITLGDEFQGIVADLDVAVRMIFFMDAELIDIKDPFRIRYSLNYGTIDTPVSTENAHGMLGEGLTNARRAIEVMKQEKRTYTFETGNDFTDELLNGLFELYDSIYSDWSEKDREYLSKFFEKDDYKWVSEQISKDPSTAWRKRNSLKLNEFNTARKLIQTVALQF